MTNLCWKLGSVRVTRVEETRTAFPATDLLPEATPEALRPHESWMRPHFMDAEGNFILSIHSLVVESCGRRILVDTCAGDREVPGFEALRVEGDLFLRDLAAAGFPRETIDFVLCTHLHFDHVGWNTMREGDRWVPTFPNARYLFARSEWAHWSKEEHPVFSTTLNEAVRPVIDAGLADLVDTDHRVTDEVSLVPTPGHTPGHVSVRIKSGGVEAFITGDMTHSPVQWAEPDWTMLADVDGPEAVRTRRAQAETLARRGSLVIGTHYAPPCAGRVVRRGAGWTFEAEGS